MAHWGTLGQYVYQLHHRSTCPLVLKCIKIFFGFHKYSSVTNMLLQLGLPSFDTVLHNARIRFANNLYLLDTSVVSVSCRLL